MIGDGVQRVCDDKGEGNELKLGLRMWEGVTWLFLTCCTFNLG